jgi:hypothetical protein
MKTVLAVILLAAASALTGHFVLGANAPDRPNGVEADHWIAMNERLGFVMVPKTFGYVGPRGDAQVLFAEGPVEGYFAAKTATGWKRIEIVRPESMFH